MALYRIVSPLITAANLARQAFGSWIGADNESTNLDERRGLYEYLWNCYANQQYDRARFKGSLDYVNETLGEAAAGDLAGLFNPVERIVETNVSNIFNGAFGDEIRINPFIGSEENPQRRTVNPAIIAPLHQIFGWSNLTIENKTLTRYGAIFGTCGIRVVARVGRDYPNDRLEERRVYLQFEHPGQIIGQLTDARGNVTQSLTENQRREGDLSAQDGEANVTEYTVRTLATKTEFATFRKQQGGWFGGGDFVPFDEISGQENGRFARYPNALGVCPYVVAHHRRIGGLWGAWAFYGQMRKIDILNALVAHINRQIFRHVNATYLISGTGPAPKEIDFSGGSYLYHRRRGDDSKGIDFQALVTNLKLDDAITHAKFLLSEIRDALPELKATDGEYLSNQSGETVAQLRLPAEQKILEARTLYEDGLIRALKIALSYGILLGLWNRELRVSPDRAGAELAFRRGQLDFQFNTRPALPVTTRERLELEQMESDVADAREERRINTAANTRELPAGGTGAGNGAAELIA
jgi:hypothetical protein